MIPAVSRPIRTNAPCFPGKRDGHLAAVPALEFVVGVAPAPIFGDGGDRRIVDDCIVVIAHREHGRECDLGGRGLEETLSSIPSLCVGGRQQVQYILNWYGMYRASTEHIQMAATTEVNDYSMSSLLIGVIALALSSCVPKSLTDAFQIDKRTSAMLVPSARFHPLPWQLSVDSWRPTAKIRKHHASSPRPFFCDQRSGKGGDDDAASGDGRRWLLPHVVVAPWARALLIFGLGYGLGGASAPGWQRQSRVASRVGATRIALIVLVLRDVWRSTPQWAKPRIAKYGRNVINFLSVPFRKKSVRYLDETDVEDGDDITDISNIATKIQSAVSLSASVVH